MRVLLLSLVLLVAHPASAELIEVDLATPGDARITRDTASGLDWLDLTETLELSYDDVQGGAGGWLAAGWTYATGSQVCALFAALGSAPAPCPGFLGEAGNTVSNHLALLGVTLSDGDNTGSSGLYDDGDAGDGDVGSAIANYTASLDLSQILVEDDSVPTDLASANAGSFLVRAVPSEPVPLLVPALPPAGTALCALLMAAGGSALLRSGAARRSRA